MINPTGRNEFRAAPEKAQESADEMIIAEEPDFESARRPKETETKVQNVADIIRSKGLDPERTQVKPSFKDIVAQKISLIVYDILSVLSGALPIKNLMVFNEIKTHLNNIETMDHPGIKDLKESKSIVEGVLDKLNSTNLPDGIKNELSKKLKEAHNALLGRYIPLSGAVVNNPATLNLSFPVED